MSIESMKIFKEEQELRRWYWKELCEDLYRESEKELEKKGRRTMFKVFFGIFEIEVKELQEKKFEEIFNMMKKQKSTTKESKR